MASGRRARVFMAGCLCLCLASAACPADAPSSSAFEQAIQSAEKDLVRESGTDPVRSSGGWSLSDVLAIVAMAAALGLTVWAMRWSRGRVFRQAAGRDMRVLDRMATSRNTTLLLVRMRGRDYWLADHPHGVTVLADWPAEDGKDTMHNS